VVLDPLDDAARTRCRAHEAGSIESHHGLSSERSTQRTGSPVDSISIRHTKLQITSV